MSITLKVSKADIQFDLADAFTTTLSASKRSLSQRDAALVEKQQWELKKTVDKRHTKREWEYKVVWADSWVHENELENAERLLQQFEKKDSRINIENSSSMRNVVKQNSLMLHR